MITSEKLWSAITKAQKEYPGASMARDIFESNYDDVLERIKTLESAIKEFISLCEPTIVSPSAMIAMGKKFKQLLEEK